MACIVKCAFCGHDACDHDHDGCAKDYGEELKQWMLDWYTRYLDEPLPADFRKRFKRFRGEKWRAYQEYLGRLKERAETEKKRFLYAAEIQGALQLVGDQKIRKLDPDFQVRVSVICTPIPKC